MRVRVALSRLVDLAAADETAPGNRSTPAARRADGAAARVLVESRGVRARWHRGRGAYAAFVVRVRRPAVSARVVSAQRRFGDLIVPESVRDLHVTFFVAGFPVERPARDDEVSMAWLAAASAQLRRATSTFRLVVGAAATFRSAPYLTVEDRDGGLIALRSALARLGRELRFEPFVPHLTLGRYARRARLDEVTRALAPLQDLDPIEIRVDRCALVFFDPRKAGSPLCTQTTIRFSGRVESGLAVADLRGAPHSRAPEPET